MLAHRLGSLGFYYVMKSKNRSDAQHAHGLCCMNVISKYLILRFVNFLVTQQTSNGYGGS